MYRRRFISTLIFILALSIILPLIYNQYNQAAIVRNKETDNLNILFLGVAGKKLLMTSVYSINYREHNKKAPSGAVFFPPNTLVDTGKGEDTLGGIYEKYGPGMAPGKIKGILERVLRVDIAYYVSIDKRALKEAEKFFQPIYVEEERVHLENLFEMKAGPQDRIIIRQLMEQLLRPQVYFYLLPGFVIKWKEYIRSDFPLTAKNLFFHFQIARRVDVANVKKVIAPGKRKNRNGQQVIEIPAEYLQNIIFNLTK